MISRKPKSQKRINIKRERHIKFTAQEDENNRDITEFHNKKCVYKKKDNKVLTRLFFNVLYNY